MGNNKYYINCHWPVATSLSIESDNMRMTKNSVGSFSFGRFLFKHDFARHLRSSPFGFHFISILWNDSFAVTIGHFSSESIWFIHFGDKIHSLNRIRSRLRDEFICQSLNCVYFHLILFYFFHVLLLSIHQRISNSNSYSDCQFVYVLSARFVLSICAAFVFIVFDKIVRFKWTPVWCFLLSRLSIIQFILIYHLHTVNLEMLSKSSKRRVAVICHIRLLRASSISEFDCEIHYHCARRQIMFPCA